jgi:hypothetical protein
LLSGGFKKVCSGEFWVEFWSLALKPHKLVLVSDIGHTLI